MAYSAVVKLLGWLGICRDTVGIHGGVAPDHHHLHVVQVRAVTLQVLGHEFAGRNHHRCNRGAITACFNPPAQRFDSPGREPARRRLISGVVGFVKFDGTPTPIPEEQIKNLQLLLSTTEKFEISLDEFELGDNVEVYRGALKGFKGMLVEYKGQKRALLRIEAINQSLLVEIHPSNLKKIIF